MTLNRKIGALKIGAASALALAMALPAYAQPYRETDDSVRARQDYEAQRQEYDAKRDTYDAQQSQYRDRRDNYEAGRANYADARRQYERRLAEWDRARAIYDRRYGYGAYARMYTRPTWDQRAWASYSPPPYAGYYGRNTTSTVPVRCSNNSTVAGGLIGALAGAVLGSNIASRGSRTEGAVLGGVAGAVIGGSVGNANDNYKCDANGPYFSYNETLAYREGRTRYSSSYDTAYYSRQRCRLAPAPVDAYGRDVRYVRVCPDETGRYRITG